MHDEPNLAKLKEIGNAYARRARLWKETEDAHAVYKDRKKKLDESDAALLEIVGERTLPLFETQPE